MTRDWQPGDVALCSTPDGPSRQLRSITNDGWWNDEGAFDDDAYVISARPIVVIDPEDREQVERLMNAYCGFPLEDDEVPEMQAALRSLITPPRPEEPTADAALIECERDGKRGRAVLLGGSWTFYGECLRDGGAIYDDFTAVRVLSEGVTA